MDYWSLSNPKTMCPLNNLRIMCAYTRTMRILELICGVLLWSSLQPLLESNVMHLFKLVKETQRIWFRLVSAIMAQWMMCQILLCGKVEGSWLCNEIKFCSCNYKKVSVPETSWSWDSILEFGTMFLSLYLWACESFCSCIYIQVQ